MIKSLVTGGAGYFGDLLTRKLLDRGYFVRILDLNLPADSYPGTEVVQADIRDPHAVLPACEGIDVVYHNAAELALENLLELCARSAVKKVIYASSSAAYGIPNPIR